jgi:light-regulated signal transduction histidine kinase (bacteriophytochrome)
MLNKLLKRQLSKYGISTETLDDSLGCLLKAISSSYDHFEKDRIIQERTMELNSEELTTANKRLRSEAQENALVLRKLKESLHLIQEDEESTERFKQQELTLVDLADIIQKEIERRKEAEAKQKHYMQNLERTNRELDQFAYVVSHDLKAPLRAIASLSEWIEEDSAEQLTAESKSNLELLRGRALRMESLIHGILAYSKAGKKRDEKIEVDTNNLLEDIIDSLNPSDNITVHLAENMPIVEAETIKLQQVFSNLISNAIKYMDKEQGEISIGYIPLPDSYQFYIQDNGPGIEKEYQERVFMIFQTLSTRDEVESTGIGLSIVKKIVEEHGGKVWIDSEKGKGCKFSFTWPTKIITSKKLTA